MKGARRQFWDDIHADEDAECAYYASDPADRYPDAAELAELSDDIERGIRRRQHEEPTAPPSAPLIEWGPGHPDFVEPPW